MTHLRFLPGCMVRWTCCPRQLSSKQWWETLSQKLSTCSRKKTFWNWCFLTAPQWRRGGGRSVTCVGLKLPETLRKRLKRRQDSQGRFHTVIPPGSGVRPREVRKGDFWTDRGSSERAGLASPLSCKESRPCGVFSSFLFFFFTVWFCTLVVWLAFLFFSHVILYMWLNFLAECRPLQKGGTDTCTAEFIGL